MNVFKVLKKIEAGQNWRHFVDDFLKCIFLEENIFLFKFY